MIKDICKKRFKDTQGNNIGCYNWLWNEKNFLLRMIYQLSINFLLHYCIAVVVGSIELKVLRSACNGQYLFLPYEHHIKKILEVKFKSCYKNGKKSYGLRALQSRMAFFFQDRSKIIAQVFLTKTIYS